MSQVSPTVPDPSPSNHLASLLKPRFLPFSCPHLLPVFRLSTWYYAPRKAVQTHLPGWRRSKPGSANSPLCSFKEPECPLPYHRTLLPHWWSLRRANPSAVWAIAAELGLLGSRQSPALPLGLLGSRALSCPGLGRIWEDGLDGENALLSGGLGFPGLRTNLSCQEREVGVGKAGTLVDGPFLAIPCFPPSGPGSCLFSLQVKNRASHQGSQEVKTPPGLTCSSTFPGGSLPCLVC